MLEGRSYVPLLHLRLAETRALRELPDATKNLIFPVIRLRPWLTSKSFARSFEVVQEAFGDRRYGADLDSSPHLPSNDTTAYREFRSLFDTRDGYAQYYEVLEAHANAVPVLRLSQDRPDATEAQLQHVRHLDRGLIIRVQVEHAFDVADTVRKCVAADVTNRAFVLDCGWVQKDLLGRAAQCAALAQSIVAEDADAEIVIAGGSFPDSFAKKGDTFTIAAQERPLFNEVRRQLNAGRIVFGDWASTRPPTEPIPMTNVPRIDTAHRSEWASWRSADGESYTDVAARARRDEALDGDPDLWGEYMIVSTARGADTAIKSPTMAAAVRINLHMAIQANYDNPRGVVVEDEPVGEDL